MTRTKVTLFCILFLAASAHAQFACFTHSTGVLFKGTGKDEAETQGRVVAACIEHPVTKKEECEKNVRCFPEVSAPPTDSRPE